MNIVLHHGLFGMSNFQVGPLKMEYFRGIADAFGSRGHAVTVTKVHPTGSVALRATQLKQTMLERAGGGKYVIIAHSMGGLDARHMIAHLGMADRVRALVTISAPHRGSSYADWCLKHVGHRLGGIRLAKMLNLDIDALEDLTLDGCARFNERTPNVGTVKYFSISASRPWYQVPPWAMHAWRVINAVEGANDGLVSVKSAQWGAHLETWAADHWHTINKRFVMERKAGATGDIVPHYLRMLERISGDW
jgi:triacylglycerol lipase